MGEYFLPEPGMTSEITSDSEIEAWMYCSPCYMAIAELETEAEDEAESMFFS